MTDSTLTSTYPLIGCNWELTLRCPLNCIHCGSRAGNGRTGELSLDECFPVADQLVSLGCKELTMIGGEVFLFKGWDKLSRYLTDNGVAVNIVTNGFKLGESEIEQIKHAGLVNVGLSIDGMETNHNRIRGRTDAFQRLRNSMQRLNTAGIKMNAVTSLMNFNIADLEDIYIFLLEYGVQVWQLQLVIAMGNMAKRYEFTLNPEQVQQIIQFIRDKNMDRRMVVIAADSIGYFNENETYIRGYSSPICFWGGCAAGLSSVFIDSVGNVKGCGALYDDVFIEGNVRKTSLIDIWKDPDNFAYNRHFTTDLLAGRCKDCEAGDVCRGGCRSANYFTSKSLDSNVFCCRYLDE